ncbi:NahK/ErcS family hybrid sensor histidine kinase/response regulator [Breoghania sp.]|uniref:hybrid sensor histidine kinase/response regulator n=1 Tax=Breoghania sp. TaxID=2065378 RepID=UPI0029CA625A|nr:NahK/ErcS family hybrid sensor histidine kinase/response regulator [Breoghania sp.]
MTTREAPGLSRRQLQEQLRALEAENAKLRTIRDALIRQVDRSHDFTGNAFKLFQSVAELETNVEKRIQRVARAMNEAKIARRQLQQAIDSIGEGFILYDSDDKIVLCNRRYRELFPGLADMLVAGAHFEQIVRRAAETGAIVEAVTDPQAWLAARVERHQRKHCQFQQLLSDGRWIQISERDTEEGGRVVIVSEITHFKRLQETRRLTDMSRKPDLLVATVASIAQGVVVFDADMRLVTWNSQAAMLLNLPYVDIHAGMEVRELLRLVWRHGARVPRTRKDEAIAWVTHVDARYPLRLEITYRGGRVVATNFRSMPDDGFVITLTDVTAQNEAARLLERSNEELEQRVEERTRALTELNEALQDEVRRHEATARDLERARRAAEMANLSKTRFLAAASHDLLQPLNAARLYLSALDSTSFVTAEARDLLANVSQAFHSTEDLLSALLDISKMDAGGYEPQLCDVPVGDLLRILETEFGALARQANLRLTVVPSSAVVRSDPQLLRRIVQNFLSNALKYTASGRILLGVRRRGASVVLEIHDTGNGIAREHHQTIFEEFRRATTTGTQRPGGLGLGLAIVKRAAGLLNHEIELDSEPGRGSRFAVVVPLAPTCAAPPSPQSPSLLPGAPRSADAQDESCTLFVLENDSHIADAMVRLLATWQMRAVTAPSYGALLKRARTEGLVPCAIIADLHLDGDIDGIDAIILLRAHLGRQVPGILVTADRSQEIRRRAAEKGIEYFSKPVRPGQLRAYLAHLSAEAKAAEASSGTGMTMEPIA